MTKTAFCIPVLALTILAYTHGARAEGDSEGNHSELAKAMVVAKISLASGLSASESRGTPISAKFEVEDGKLQLSVYTEKSGKFSEVVVDHQSGKVAESEAITEGEDLSAAKAQSAVIAKAKRSLVDAVRQATTEQSGYTAISVVPKIANGHATAEVTLNEGQAWKTVTERLD